MERDYAAEIAKYVDNMQIKKALGGGFDRLDTYNQMQELGKRCSILLAEALLEKEQTIQGMRDQLEEHAARQTQTDVALFVAEQQAKWIIDAANNFVQDERQRAQRVFQDALMQQQRAVNELEARKKELKGEILRMEGVIRDMKACFSNMSGQIEKYRTIADQVSENLTK